MITFINTNYIILNISRIEIGFTINAVIDNIYNNCVKNNNVYFTNLNNDNMNSNSNDITSDTKTFSLFNDNNNNILINNNTQDIKTYSFNTDKMNEQLDEYIDNKNLIYNYCDNMLFPNSNYSIQTINTSDIPVTLETKEKNNDFSYQFQKLTKKQLIEILSSMSEEELEEIGYRPINN